MPSVLLQSATLTNGTCVDIRIEGDRVSHIEISPSSLSADEIHNLSGHIVVESFVEPHAHLDKAFLADRIINPSGDLLGAIHGLHAVRDTITFQDIVERSTRAATLLSQNGVTSVRTHADTMVNTKLLNIEALQETKRACRHFIDIQIAMLLEWPLSGPESASRRSLARDAIAAGADVVGGCPHLDPHPHAAIDYLLELAVSNNLPLDIHADENLRPDSDDLEYLADTMLKNGITHPVNASHCVSLSTQDEATIKRVAEKVAAAGISVTALPQTNLYLQGRAFTTNVPRAITPLQTLSDTGVVVASGGDNLQDPFNLMGRGDPLEIASLLVTSAHVSPTFALAQVSTNAHTVVYGQSCALAIGAKANLVGVRAATLRESIAMGPPDRFVVYGGVVVNDHIRNRKHTLA